MLSDRCLCLSVCLSVCLSDTQKISTCFLASLLHRRRSLEANQTLHGVWPSAGLVTIYTFPGAFAPKAILRAAKFTLRPSLALPYIGSVTALEQWASTKLCSVVQGMELRNTGGAEGATCIRQGGHHVGHRPTF